MKDRLYLFLAEGFEETEALATADVLKRGGIDVNLVSITSNRNVKGAHGFTVVADMTLSEVNPDAVDGVILPGGLPGATNLEASDELNRLIQKVQKKGGLLSAICAAPVVYGKLGLLKDKNVTCYPSFETQFENRAYLKQGVVTDNNIITGRGPAYAFDFGLAILEYVAGKEKAEEVAAGLLKNE